MELEFILLRAIGQTQKGKYHIFSFTYRIHIYVYMYEDVKVKQGLYG